jgi:mono/diheme cytochrome c family protein
VFLFCLAFAASAADNPEAREFFENRVRPVFVASCLPCHSETRMGDLDMSSREGLLKGGKIGTSLVPGKPEESILIQAITHQHERLRMPAGQPRLSERQIADISAWVKSGAYWPESAAAVANKSKKYVITPEQRNFWSLVPVSKPAIPAVKNAAWAHGDLDRLLLARMEAQNVVPAPPADRRTLLRRAYYDLIGLPPTAAEIDAFIADKSPDAFAKVVDKLLAMPQYGERWGRHWLDLARYSDDKLEAEVDAPYANAFRYRDWVIDAMNQDMPYDRFLKAQIAGDLMGDKQKYAAGLGMFALRPHTQDDRVDVTGRVFLGLTTGCAQCHDHKFDPIPTTDYYALLGIFESTKDGEVPLADETTVKSWKAQKKLVDQQKIAIRDFLHEQATSIARMFALQTARYVTAARSVIKDKQDQKTVAAREKLDAETFDRWVKYLANPSKDHPYLKDWNTDKFDAQAFQDRVLAILKEREAVDDENKLRAALKKRKGGSAEDPTALKAESFYLWRDLFFSDFYGKEFKQEDDGLLYYGPNRGYYESDGTVERFLQGEYKEHLARLRADLKALEAKLPPQYSFFHTIEDAKAMKLERVRIGGSAANLGEEVPRRFLTVLSDGKPFTQGAGRLELAEAIASPTNPLTARVAVNRIWHHHFGTGIVRTPSDFGFMGDRPSHPEVLDYLAVKFVESGWSTKAIHREIMLSSAYQLSATKVTANLDIDPDNRLLWRANVRRLDAEALRDSLLAVTGELDLAVGGKPIKVSDPANKRRSVYGFVSRRKLDGTMSLFDFPNPNITSDKRSVTITPPQQLFLLNGEFTIDRAAKLATTKDIKQLYRTIYGRLPGDSEIRLANEFLAKGGTWTQYAQALLNANEFVLIN